MSVGWSRRKRFWSSWQVLRFTLAKQRKIVPPKPNTRKIGAVPFSHVHPDIPLKSVRVFDKLPKEEAALGMRVLAGVGLFLTRLRSPMMAGAPEIDRDIDKALDQALTAKYRRKFRRPELPTALAGVGIPELEVLALESPYSVFIERDSDGRIQWDFRMLGAFEHHQGLRSLGLRVIFTESPETHRLRAAAIESDELGRVARGDPNWEASKALAVCAATTHMSLTRHFNYVHLISANHWDITARNHLASNHALYRLIWPHMANSLYTNYGITRSQLLPDGDFVNIFSFTHRGLMAYYDAMYDRYEVTITDPVADWERRGLNHTEFHSPSQENLVELFTVMHAHARRYVCAYYADDESLRNDRAVVEWLEALDALIPHGVGALLGEQITREGLARLIGAFIYEGNTIHEMAGTMLWDYQLWADRNPTRIYADGRRVPVDVFQRMVNYNFGLQLKRAPLLDDYGYLATDSTGAGLFTQFYMECRALQERYDRTHAETWLLQPKNLEMSMNG